MAHLITTAIPTDEVAISFLKSNQVKYPSIDITPFVAKELYNTYIFSKRHFICPTDGCNAPVTCRSIDPSSKNRPTFVNQSLSTNKHSSNCPYHPNNYVSVVTNEAPSGESFKYLNSGEIISDLSLAHGFQPLDNTTTTRTSSSPVFTSPTTKKSKETTSSNSTKKEKKVRSHLKSLENHVEMYKHNPDFGVLTNKSEHPIPIKYMFKFLKRNVLFQNQNTVKYSYIYYSQAFLSETNNASVLRLSFKCPLPVDNLTIYPSLIVSKAHIENEYPDIYDQFVSGIETEFEVFTTLPFLKKYVSPSKIYINFSSFQESANVDPFSDELFYNLYIN
ncbi:hypothetical protein QJV15_11440 [Listeria cossartiae subsp. cayugensis]|uniref:hypothetical protein n=1 Tax=Listeria cossartiae TaxID=2838249 RepID=UPI0028808D88|nr:hypothetical protein [Listeria cossartiae]MDT0001486.1 hypothetical protein [Listeria cossartiae subsp. cayugensis]MDT0009292.1 hypothetical protein [Listeria cossartiae subsp. cayugensis]MDT0031516.1 hypothetical protein [Listeria cossartiae subsp. cayugensis]MDT0039632.1 hypothetical protein [Listeria cossartiae subsp. cayugensis]MDT0044589.1 hypothetical protein [Listeria cossartiae subsp. cayugensis]